MRTEKISEWICLEHTGFVQQRAFQWWALHSLECVPGSIDDALDLFNRKALGMPSEITTIEEGRFKKILDRKVSKPATWLGDTSEGIDDGFSPRVFTANEEDIPF